MSKGEGRGEGGTENGTENGEDLFEDLDKFFAPIQDVDWPETGDPSAPPKEASHEVSEDEPAKPSTEEGPGSAAAVAPFEGPVRIESDEEDLESATRPTPGQEDLFAGPAPEGEQSEVSVRSTGASEGTEDTTEDDGVSSFLFEAEAEEELEPDDSGSTFAGSPSAYVDLPGPRTEDESAAELEEGPMEAAPDLEAVEAAADHFAESVRGDVSAEAEPPPTTPRPTEEIQIAALLGDDEDETSDAGQPEGTRTVRVGAEGLGGPSWQEPTAMEVGTEPERRAGRDVPMAFVTGVVLAALALGALAIGSGAFAIVAGAFVLLAQGEFYFALQKRHYQPATALALVSGALVLGAAYYRGERAMLAMVGLTVVATFLWYMTVPAQHRRNVVTNIALTLLGVIYIPLLAGYALVVLEFLPDGRGLALSIIGLTVAYDVAAFVVGTWWGSRPLAPNISPKKSWEGAIGATFVTAAVAVGAVAPSVELLETIPRAVGLAVVVGIFAPLGDLAESLLKRDLEIKDMGSVLPGHGGVLDRIDALLFVAPAAFIYLRLILL
ncbi:MAG: phosphatidate cytidylyltransferase [Actinomycetota bacterium]